MMTTLSNIWAWLKLNAVLASIVATVFVVAVGFSYVTGRDHGADACEARYEKRDAKHRDAVIDKLNAINSQNIELGKLWARQNRQADAEVKTEIETIYREVEKIVEVPVQVEGPCRIDYDGTARLLDGAVRAAYPD